MNTEHELIKHLDQLHTTELGAVRIARNLALDAEDAVEWCKAQIQEEHTVITRKGKNWYADTGRCIITVNAHSCTIITAHEKQKGTKGIS